MGASALRFPSSMDITEYRRALWAAGITHLYREEENTQVIILMDPRRYPDAIQLLGESKGGGNGSPVSENRPEETVRPKAQAVPQRSHWWQRIKDAFLRAPITGSLMVICLLVFLLMQVAPISVMTSLGFSPLLVSASFHQVWSAGIGQGQVWRLFTPMLIHFNLPHIVFDMIWLGYLGSEIEKRERAMTLILLVLAGAAVSNVMQSATMGPLFGGMSGVVYALLGFTWLTNHLKHEAIYRVTDALMFIMVVWLVLCMTPVITSWSGPIASVAHLSGLAFGLLFAYLKHLTKRIAR